MNKVFCTNCDEEKEYYVKTVKRECIVKGTTIKANLKECYCAQCNKPVFVYEIEKQNQIAVYDAYKEKMGLYTSKQIIALRKKYDLSQRALAKLICCGEKNIARYENGAVQDLSINLLLILLDNHPDYFGLTNKNKELDFIVDLTTTYQPAPGREYKNTLKRCEVTKGGVVLPC